MKRFKEGKVFVATDVASRGLCIQNVYQEDSIVVATEAFVVVEAMIVFFPTTVIKVAGGLGIRFLHQSP
jgi:hypothetical protein